MTRIATILMLVLAGISCRGKQVPVLVEARDTTSVIVRTQILREFIELPPDSSLVRAYLACDSLGQVYLKTIDILQGERVKQDVRLRNNEMIIKAKDRALQEQVKETRDSVRIEYNEIPVPYPVEVNKLTSWQSFQVWTGRIALLWLFLILLYTVLKKRYNIF